MADPVGARRRRGRGRTTSPRRSRRRWMPTGPCPRVRSTGTFAAPCSTRSLASRATPSTSRVRPRRGCRSRSTSHVHATNEQVLRVLGATARMLALVATASPASARGYHEGGMADTSGFLAMAIDEVIVHGADAAAGLGLAYDPPEQLARKVVDRLFPWAPTDTDGGPRCCGPTDVLPLPGQPRSARTGAGSAHRSTSGRATSAFQAAADLVRVGRHGGRLARRPVTPSRNRFEHRREW